jgi:hypothetical protein
MPIEVLGRAGGDEFASLQKSFSRCVARTLAREGLVDTHLLVCTGFVTRTIQEGSSVCVYRSSLFERTFLFEVFPQKGQTGVAFSMTVSREDQFEKLWLVAQAI